MQNLGKLSKFFLYLAALSCVLWFGGYFSRILLMYQIFGPKDLLLKPYVTDQNLGGIFITLNSAVSFTMTFYTSFIVSFAIFILTSKIKLKEEGWLFIIMMIVIITAPFELYLMSYDYKIAYNVFYNTMLPRDVLALYVRRIKVINSFPLIEIFSYCAIIFLFVFQPLRYKKTNEA
ncbi:MAG: hypothetical protein WCJ01_11155 [Ignavibacteria bacterium]